MTPAAAGNAFALATALSWASAVVLFKKSGEHLDPVDLNTFKSVVALVLLAATFPAAGVPFLPAAPTGHLALLLASGVLGIAIADTLFFQSLSLLGATRSAIVDCLYAPFVVIASVAWLGERPSPRALLGGVLVVSAVLLTRAREVSYDLAPRDLRRGILLGALSMASTAVAIVAVKPLLPGYPVLWTTSVRLLGGVLGLLAFGLLRRRGLRTLRLLAPRPAWWVAVPGAVLGNYVALLLWVAGFKYGEATSAAILNQTSTLFIVVLAALFLRERFTGWHALATGLAFVGAAVVVW